MIGTHPIWEFDPVNNRDGLLRGRGVQPQDRIHLLRGLQAQPVIGTRPLIHDLSLEGEVLRFRRIQNRLPRLQRFLRQTREAGRVEPRCA